MLIPETLPKTKMATFSVHVPHPNPEMKRLPTANGTGFFISEDGYFITARHVITQRDNGFVNPNEISLTKSDLFPGASARGVKIVKDWINFDLVLLKADFSKSERQDFFKKSDCFYYVDIDFNVIPEGTNVYAFGYPLPKFKMSEQPKVTYGFYYCCPRTTSAIISSHYDTIGPIFSPGFPKFYVIDKALNYGNSGGPIIVENNGKAISVCVRFQPTMIPQNQSSHIIIPSLYGITSSLKNIEKDLNDLSVI